MKTKTLIFI